MKKKQGIVLLAALAALSLGAVLGFLRDHRTPESTSVDPGKSEADPTPCTPESCQLRSCGKGFILQKKSGDCCPECVQIERSTADCDGFVCDDCPPGPRVRSCCPECVQAHDKQCEDGREEYTDQRTEFEERLVTCASDTDCMLASFVDDCRSTCSMPLNKMQLGEVVTELQVAARELCGTCTPENFECPSLATKSVACLGGKCVFDPEG